MTASPTTLDYPYNPARWMGGRITPDLVILHDTASRLKKGAAANYLRDNGRKVSVHFVVERDGSIEQQVPLDHRANHAGASHYHGRDGCNGFSIGVEIVNPGRMTLAAEHQARTWYGESFSIAYEDIRDVTTPQHGSGLWMPYTAEQIDAVLELLDKLFDEVPTLQDIRTHWYVSPGRKIDTNPLFPLEQVRARILGREEPAEEAALAAAIPSPPDEFVEINTPGDTLNLRRWPSFNPNVIAAIPDRTLVPVIRQGEIDGRLWRYVQYGGAQGWVLAAYTNPVTYKELT